MRIHVKLSNALTSKLVEFTITVEDTMNFEEIAALHSEIEETSPDCHVNFAWLRDGAEASSFICGMPTNMRRDELELTFEQYMAKWYAKTNFAGLNEVEKLNADITRNNLIGEYLGEGNAKMN